MCLWVCAYGLEFPRKRIHFWHFSVYKYILRFFYPEKRIKKVKCNPPQYTRLPLKKKCYVGLEFYRSFSPWILLSNRVTSKNNMQERHPSILVYLFLGRVWKYAQNKRDPPEFHCVAFLGTFIQIVQLLLLLFGYRFRKIHSLKHTHAITNSSPPPTSIGRGQTYPYTRNTHTCPVDWRLAPPRPSLPSWLTSIAIPVLGSPLPPPSLPPNPTHNVYCRFGFVLENRILRWSPTHTQTYSIYIYIAVFLRNLKRKTIFMLWMVLWRSFKRSIYFRFPNLHLKLRGDWLILIFVICFLLFSSNLI